MCTDWSVNYNILLSTHLSKEWNWTDWSREASPTAPRNPGSMRLGSTMISSEGALTRLLKISLTLTFFPLLSLSLTSWPLRTSEDKVDRASDTASGPVCASVITEVFPSSKPTSRRLGDKPFSRSDWTLSAKKKKKKTSVHCSKHRMHEYLFCRFSGFNLAAVICVGSGGHLCSWQTVSAGHVFCHCVAQGCLDI